jgi:hypothetical protein
MVGLITTPGIIGLGYADHNYKYELAFLLYLCGKKLIISLYR